MPKCTHCGSDNAHPRTFFGSYMGHLCDKCHTEKASRACETIIALANLAQQTMEKKNAST